MKKKIYTLIIIGFINAIAFNAQSQNLLWAFKVGGANTQEALNVTTDVSGNIITSGYFNGSCDFDPGTGTATLVAPAGTSDGFVAKYGSNNSYQWAKSFGSPTDGVSCNASAVDAGGNVFTGGYFGGTINLDPGAGTVNVTSAGFLDGFVVKLDAAGNYLWGFTIAGVDFFDQVNALTTDVNGNLYITGYFQGTIDFDPSVNTTNLTTDVSSNDVFLAKYDASGNLLWAKSIGGSGTLVNPNAITLDATGNVILTGMFDGTPDFNPGAGSANLTSLGDDIFIAKYDASGNYIWANRIGSADVDEPQSIVTDATNNVYISGSFYQTVDFNPGAGTANLTSVGQADIFFASYDAAGNYRWANRFGSTAPTFDEIGYDLAVSDSGFIYMCGIYRNTIDIDPSAATVNLISNGQTDMFLAKFDAQGNYQTAFTIGGTSLDYANSIVIDPSNTIYLAGAFTVTCDFDPSAGTTNLTANGTDMFLAKYGSGTVGIFENSFENSFAIYPNPVTNEFTVSGLLLTVGDEIKIYDVVGKEIYSEKIGSGTSNFKLQTLNYPEGLYFFEITSSNKKSVSKFIKSN